MGGAQVNRMGGVRRYGSPRGFEGFRVSLAFRCASLREQVVVSGRRTAEQCPSEKFVREATCAIQAGRVFESSQEICNSLHTFSGIGKTVTRIILANHSCHAMSCTVALFRAFL